jgi:hypothetical protein
MSPAKALVSIQWSRIALISVVITSKESAFVTTVTPNLRSRPNHRYQALLAIVLTFVTHAIRKKASRPTVEPFASLLNCHLPNVPQSAMLPSISAMIPSKHLHQVLLLRHLQAFHQLYHLRCLLKYLLKQGQSFP